MTAHHAELRVVHEDEAEVEPIIGPHVGHEEQVHGPQVRSPRLARHQIFLEDGHEVGISVAGHGIPLVVVHGFSAEGFLYAQTLSRLVSMGFKVIAVDTAGHGGTAGLPSDGGNIVAYTELLDRILKELGIERCIVAGHSMGGRLVTQLAAIDPDRVIAVVLIDAIVGDTWDRMVYLFRVWPPLLAAVGAMLLVDSAAVAPVMANPKQAVKLARLAVPTLVGHVVQPWRLMGPVLSILRTRSSRYALDAAAEHGVPFFVLHGDRDFAVPMRTAADAARRVGAPLVKIERAGHSWLLRDPETLPAVITELLSAGLGEAIEDAKVKAGLDPETATVAEIESEFYEDDALILRLTPHGARHVGPTEVELSSPAYRWATVAPN